MNLPEIIELNIESGDANDLSNLVVTMKIKSGRKNPYYIIFPKTDEGGSTSLVKRDLTGQFKDHWEEAVMDYDGTLETANPVVEFSLFDSTWLEKNKDTALSWPLLKHEKEKWRSRQELYDYLTSSNNRKFNCKPVDFDLSKSSQIVLEVIAI